MFDAAAGEPAQNPAGDGVGHLDARAAIDHAVALRATADRAEADLLAVAAHYADLHPVTTGTLAAGDPTRTWTSLKGGVERLLPLAGEGTPQIAEFAVADLAAALHLSTDAGRTLVGDALELRHRLPRLWRRVHDGRLPTWRARRVAQATRHLSTAGASYVDAQVAPFAHRVGPVTVDRLVSEAQARFDPEAAEADAEAAADSRHVTVHDHQATLAGTCRVEVVTDLADALLLDHTLDAVADHLGALGDQDPHRVRRAKALGTLADPQAALDLLTTPTGTASEGLGDPRPEWRPRPRLVLHVHLAEAALTGTAAEQSAGGSPVGRLEGHGPVLAEQSAGGSPVGRLEGHGPVLAEQVRAWASRPGLDLRVTPVVDLNHHLAVDAYEIPDRITHHVDLRDHTCSFPWCERPTRSHRRRRHPGLDHDHVTPYDDTGPPGQTSTDNLTPLCRTHHRIKTHGTWINHALHPGATFWTNRFGARYLVDGTGTTPLPA